MICCVTLPADNRKGDVILTSLQGTVIVGARTGGDVIVDIMIESLNGSLVLRMDHGSADRLADILRRAVCLAQVDH